MVNTSFYDNILEIKSKRPFAPGVTMKFKLELKEEHQSRECSDGGCWDMI